MSDSVKRRWTQVLIVDNNYDENGNPTGGSVLGTGLDIKWQDGPLGWCNENNQPKAISNGAFTEDVILAAITRLKFFQENPDGSRAKFACRENACAITHLEEALMWLQARHDDRVERQVQGEHKA